MTALSDRIAAEHHYAPRPDTVRGPIPYHLCAAGCEGVILEDQGDVRRHVADVTERAVREQIAWQLEARVTRNIGGHPYSDVARTYQHAARIAREGTTP